MAKKSHTKATKSTKFSRCDVGGKAGERPFLWVIRNIE